MLFLPAALLAQSPQQPPRMYLIHEEVAKPAMLMQYEAAARDILNALTEKKASPETFGMNLYMTPDFHYLYVAPLANWAAMDAMMKNWMTIGDTIGKERWREMMARAGSATASYNEFVALHRPDLSYVPANPRLKNEEIRYVKWFFYYLDPARAEESEAIARDYAALFKKKNIGDGFNVYQIVSGNDLPLLVVSTSAKSASDWAVTDEKNQAALGADVMPLAARALAATRRYEIREGIRRPDLSYPMAAPPAAKK